MDVRLFASVLWRFKLVMLAGIIAAACLTTLTIAKVSLDNGSPKLSYRQSEGWTSTATIWITQAGFPLGRSVYDKYLQVGSKQDPTNIPKFSNPSAFSGLATIFTNLVSSDPVAQIMRREGPIDGSVTASQPTLPGNSGVTLPFVQIAGTATSSRSATALTEHAARALVRYVETQQDQNGIETDKRIVLQIVQHATPAVVTSPRKLTGPIVVFLATLMVAIGLAFLLENLRPRVRPITDRAAEEAAAAAVAAHRRTA